MPNESRPSGDETPATSGYATAADAQIILQLYDLRRDKEMRKARHFISAEFWPESAEDALRIARAYPSPQNTWLRQVTSYWEMAASFVLRGALHEGLFFDASGEMYCVYAKFRAFSNRDSPKAPVLPAHRRESCNQHGRGPEAIRTDRETPCPAQAEAGGAFRDSCRSIGRLQLDRHSPYRKEDIRRDGLLLNTEPRNAFPDVL
jgi:hypothetical protein